MSLGYHADYATTHVVYHLQCLSLGLILAPFLSGSLNSAAFYDQRPFYTVKPYCDLFAKSVSNSLVMADWIVLGLKSRLVYSS